MTEPSPSERIADALVLVLTTGVGLEDWRAIGILEREWLLYERLAPLYGRIIVVSTGGEADARIASQLGEHVRCVRLPRGTSDIEPGSETDRCLRHALGDARSAVVKTNQFQGGRLAVGITQRLRASGVDTALLARGGHIPSFNEARRLGFASCTATALAEEERLLLSHADGVVVSTPLMVEPLCWRYAVDPASVSVVPNHVPDEAFNDDADGSGREDHVVLSAGRLSSEKRLGLLIMSVARASERSAEPITIRIAGRGPLEAELRSCAGEHGVRCEFLGSLTNARLLTEMHRCTVYAQLSTHEWHPKTVFEAMACARPVLVTDAPGMREAVRNAETGVVCDPTPEHAGDALSALLDDPEERARLGRNARTAAQRECAVDAVLGREIAAHRRARTQTAGTIAA